MSGHIDNRWFDLIVIHKNQITIKKIIDLILGSERMSAAFYRFTGKHLSEVIS